jgi:hypothetical protein
VYLSRPRREHARIVVVALCRRAVGGAQEAKEMMRQTMLALLVLAGCRNAPGATYVQLHQRASFDLRCNQLALRHLDERTKVVSGCGKEMVYVEECQRIRGTDRCTWRLESAPIATEPVAATRPAPPPVVAPSLPARTYTATFPSRGFLVVRAVGGSCEVAVNGKPMGATPISTTPQFTGPARVECTTEDGEKLSRDVELTHGETVRVLFTVGPVDLGY